MTISVRNGRMAIIHLAIRNNLLYDSARFAQDVGSGRGDLGHL